MFSKSKTLFLHLALVAAGWVIAAALLPHLPAARSSVPQDSAAAPTKLPRPELDRPGGQRLLDRLSREMKPREASAPGPWAGMSLDEKAEHLYRERANPERKPPSAAFLKYFRERAINADLKAIVCGEQGPDLSYAFRHGRMEAQEILDEVTARLPEHAATPRFSAMLHEILAIEDPRRANTLIASLPEAEAEHTTAMLLQSDAFLQDPDASYELHATRPWPEDPEDLEARRGKWGLCASAYSHYHPTDYVAWLQSLPRGKERDLAISAALKPLSQKIPDEIPRLRALIDDPGIRESR